MKRILSVILVVFIFFVTVDAQDAGRIWVGGSVGFSSNKTSDKLREHHYNILPEIGYILSENLALGISLGYVHWESNTGYYDANFDIKYTLEKQNGFSINPFVRYSFLKGDLGHMFVDGGVGYTHTKNKVDPKDDINTSYYSYPETKTNILEAGFRPGIALKISGNVSLTAKYGFIGYRHMKKSSSSSYNNGYGNSGTDQTDVKTNTFSLNFDFSQALFGINFIF